MDIINKTKSQTAALYIRVSTEEQAKEGVSVNAQIETLSQYCNLYNISIYNVYKDLGISGKSIKKRKGIQNMLVDAKNGCFNMVLVWKISRLSRSLKDLLSIIDYLEQYHINFISYSEKLDTSTPVGRMTLQLLGSIAEFERNTIIENVKLGLNEFARLGGKASSVLGYDNINKQLVVNEAESKTVQTIYDLYTKENYNISMIAKYLNEHGYKTKRGKKYRGDSVSLILSNPVYIGLNRHNLNTQDEYTIKGNHTPIISIATWNKVQQNNSISKKRNYDSHSSSTTLLSGLIICPLCQSPLKIFYTKANGKSYRYYKCSANSQKHFCKGFLINADIIESSMERVMLALISDKTIVEDLISRVNNNPNSKCNAIVNKLQDLKIEIAEKKEIINGYFELFEEGKFESSDILLQRINIVENQINLLQLEVHQYEIKNSNLRIFCEFDNLEQFTGYLKKVYNSLSHEDKKRLISSLIVKIHVNMKKQISEISFTFPSVIDRQ